MTPKDRALHPNRRRLLTAAAAIAATPAGAAAPKDALRALIAASVEAEAALDPLQAARRRGRAADGFVDPLTDAYAAARAKAKTATLRGLEAIPRDRLSADDQLAYDALRYQTRTALEEMSSGVFEIERLTPLDPSFGLQVAFPDAAAGARYETQEDYEAGLRRLEGFANYLLNAIERLKEGRARGYLQPRIVVENILREVDALLAAPLEETPFYRSLRRQGAAADLDRRYADRFRQVIEGRVLAGYRLWRGYLGDTYLAVAREVPGLVAMKDGDKVYQAALRRHSTTGLTADEIHSLGLSEVTRIRGAMEEVRAALGFKGDLHALFAYVRGDPSFYCKTPDELLQRFKAIEARIWEGIPRLFNRRPRAPFEVRPLPALGEARGTGYYALGPADGSSPGVLYFNMSMLSTRPIPTLETLTLHEGIPGHHFQGSLAQENLALADSLRFGGGFTAYVEGWGLYAESLGKALGLFQDPWQWYGHLDFEMLRAARLVVDTGIHAKGWSRDRAIAFLADTTSMADKDIRVEIDRYIAAPGQAVAYKIGELRLQALRARAMTRLGPAFDVRRFHDQILMTGALPLDVLDAKIQRWIEAGGPAYG